VFLMEKGTIVYNGASHDLKAQPEIVHRYLGVSRQRGAPIPARREP
jgi:hypothetical protein